MRSTFTRLRAPSQSHNLTSHPPPVSSPDYSPVLATLAARILYKSPLPSRADLPVYILDAAAFPDAKSVDYDGLLPYVLARLPGDEELIGGEGYEVVFFAGGAVAPEGESIKGAKGGTVTADSPEGSETATKASKKSKPGVGWILQAYQVLTRAMRKRLMRLYVVHEKGWIRVVMEMFATVVSPKVRKKVVHVNVLSGLALHIPIEDLLIPPTAYYTDRRKSPDISAPYASGKRAFGVLNPLPVAVDGSARLPRVLRETTHFLLTEALLDTDGLFRVSARAQTVEVLKEAYDRGQKFIIYKERNVTITFPQHREGAGMVAVDELDLREGYDVHSAAALIKLWYHELRRPIFPPSTYQALEKLHSDPASSSLEQLQQMLSPGNELSPLPELSMKILTIHLLPLLSMVAERSEVNRMTPQNLAVVFAPNLVCGPDPMEDMKILPIVQKLLVALISHWTTHLAPALMHSDQMFKTSISQPLALGDQEDLLEQLHATPGADPASSSAEYGGEQTNGITLLDNDHDMDESSSDEDILDDEGARPPLPPRPSRTQTSGSLGQGLGPPSPLRRKPAPGDPESPQRRDDALNSRTTSSEHLPIESAALRRKPAPPTPSLPRYSILYGPAVQAALEQYEYNTGLDSSSSSSSAAARAPEISIEEVPEIHHHHHHSDENPPTYEQSTPLHENPPPMMTGSPSDSEAAEQRRPLLPPTGSEKIQRKPVGEGEGKGGG